MPRVSIKKKDYMVQDFGDWVRGRLRRMHRSQQSFADILGISQPALNRRLDNGKFYYSEMLEIFKELEATDEEILKFLRM